MIEGIAFSAYVELLREGMAIQFFKQERPMMIMMVYSPPSIGRDEKTGNDTETTLSGVMKRRKMMQRQ